MEMSWSSGLMAARAAGPTTRMATAAARNGDHPRVVVEYAYSGAVLVLVRGTRPLIATRR